MLPSARETRTCLELRNLRDEGLDRHVSVPLLMWSGVWPRRRGGCRPQWSHKEQAQPKEETDVWDKLCTKYDRGGTPQSGKCWHHEERVQTPGSTVCMQSAARAAPTPVAVPSPPPCGGVLSSCTHSVSRRDTLRSCPWGPIPGAVGKQPRTVRGGCDEARGGQCGTDLAEDRVLGLWYSGKSCRTEARAARANPSCQ